MRGGHNLDVHYYDHGTNHVEYDQLNHLELKYDQLNHVEYDQLKYDQLNHLDNHNHVFGWCVRLGLRRFRLDASHKRDAPTVLPRLRLLHRGRGSHCRPTL